MFAVMGARVQEVRAVFNEFEKSRSKSRLDLDTKFPFGLPKEVYESCRRHLSGWHLVLSLGAGSLAHADVHELFSYNGLRVDIRTSK
jgi:hypothetical protein